MNKDATNDFPSVKRGNVFIKKTLRSKKSLSFVSLERWSDGITISYSGVTTFCDNGYYYVYGDAAVFKKILPILEKGEDSEIGEIRAHNISAIFLRSGRWFLFKKICDKFHLFDVTHGPLAENPIAIGNSKHIDDVLTFASIYDTSLEEALFNLSKKNARGFSEMHVDKFDHYGKEIVEDWRDYY